MKTGIKISSDILINTTLISLKPEEINKSSINIAFAIDKNYVTPCGVSIYSIIKNNQKLKINFHIFTPDLIDISLFKSLINENLNIYIYLINTLSLQNLQTTQNFPTSIYYRLVIPFILNNKINRILYLDADILCEGSINELENINIDKYIVGVIKDKSIKKTDILNLGLPEEYEYFNSGVLLINISAWVNNSVSEKALELITKEKFEYPDQDALNIILKNDIIYLNEKYNYFSKEKIHSIFTHYVSTPKPWSISALNNEIYLEYYSQSPWKNIPLILPRNHKEMKKYSYKLWKQGKYMKSLKWFIVYFIKKLKKV